ncbi:MAG: hypothetical protein SGPRY_005583, partial [Prymnesium sp.]
VDNLDALAFPKFELVWLLCSYEGLLLACALMSYHLRQQPTALPILLVSSIFFAFAIVVPLIAWNVNSKRQTLPSLPLSKPHVVSASTPAAPPQVRQLMRAKTLEYKQTASVVRLERTTSSSFMLKRGNSLARSMSIDSIHSDGSDPECNPDSTFGGADSPVASARRTVSPTGIISAQRGHGVGVELGMRHLASKVTRWHKLDEHEKEEIKRVAKVFVLHGDWKVRSNETSATAGPSAFKFLGGCAAHHSFRCPTAGESTSSTRERAREKGMEADLAIACIMASESIGLAMFVLQRPYLDKLFNLDMILAKSSTLFSFLTLGFSTEPTVIRGSNPFPLLLCVDVSSPLPMTVQVVRQLHAVFSIASKLSEKISAARQRFRDSFKQFRFRIRGLKERKIHRNPWKDMDNSLKVNPIMVEVTERESKTFKKKILQI